MISGVADHFATKLHKRSVDLVDWLDTRHRSLLLYWTVFASLACGIRLSMASFLELPPSAQIQTALPYFLVVVAPVLSLLLAFHWFRDGPSQSQPGTRMARFGRWQPIPREEAQRLSLYGVTGIMASLLAGMLINIPVRVLEFLTAMPALPASPPTWLSILSAMMLADVVLLSSLYAIAFVAALRRVPLFPRFLAAVWGFDILMQISISRVMGGVVDLPPSVAASLHQLLEGNLQKVLISLAIWLPYLLLSKRVNITFRHRLSA